MTVALVGESRPIEDILETLYQVSQTTGVEFIHTDNSKVPRFTVVAMDNIQVFGMALYGRCMERWKRTIINNVPLWAKTNESIWMGK